MAITITDEYLDNGSPVGCKLTTSREMSERDTGGGGGGHDNGSTSDTASNTVSDEIPFHRHCQKTVCSAYGYDGQGMTRNILIPVPEDGDLQNLQKFILPTESPSTWQGYFKRNEDNIT